MTVRNLGVLRAIRRRKRPMTVRRDTSVLNTDTGFMETTKGAEVQSYGVFQQINRFDNFLADELLRLSEGERLKASTVLWTEYPLQRGSDETTGIDVSNTNGDIVTETDTGRVYKVLSVRRKWYGGFHRAVLCDVDT